MKFASQENGLVIKEIKKVSQETGFASREMSFAGKKSLFLLRNDF